MASPNTYLMPPTATADDLFDHIDDLLDFPTDTTDFTIPFPPIPMGVMDPQYLHCVAADPPPPNHAYAFHPPQIHMHHQIQIQIPHNNAAAAAAAECYDDNGIKGKQLPTTTVTADDDEELRQPQSHTNMFEDVIDMADLEWLSNFMDDSADDSFSLDLPAPPRMDMDIKFEDHSLFRTPSPVSVLEHNGLTITSGAGGGGVGVGGAGGGGVSSASSSSSSSSSSSTVSSNSGNSFTSSDPIPAFPAKARSKRSRPRRFVGPFLQPETETPDGEKKKSMKLIHPVGRERDEGVRKCTHCEIQKTPQWRAGPMGPKTLCNACGVRYKSGRLFPEYRPAASPTFVPAIHSNSHKKVVEMRIHTAPNSNSCDLLQYIRRSKH